jgi:hypothetical protein
MKKIYWAILTTACLTTPIVTHASITTDGNGSITAIMGTGNPDVNWNKVTDTDNNLELGLRAKQRFSTFTGTDNNGNYTFPANTAWNIEFSINVDPNDVGGITLASTGYSYLLDIDGLGTINLATTFGDNSYGNNGTANGAGVEGTFASLGSTYNIMQNSELHNWLGLGEGGHTFDLMVQDQAGKTLTSDRITVNGGYAPVPEPSTYAAGAVMLLPFGISMLRMVRKTRKA